MSGLWNRNRLLYNIISVRHFNFCGAALTARKVQQCGFVCYQILEEYATHLKTPHLSHKVKENRSIFVNQSQVCEILFGYRPYT